MEYFGLIQAHQANTAKHPMTGLILRAQSQHPEWFFHLTGTSSTPALLFTHVLQMANDTLRTKL